MSELCSEEDYSLQIGPFGSKIKAENYTPSGFPYMRGAELNSDIRFSEGQLVFLDPDFAADLGKFCAKRGDILLAHRGTLGKIAIIPQSSNFEKYVIGNSMLKISVDDSKILPEYLYYWFKSAYGQHEIFSRSVQVGVPAIARPLYSLRQMKVRVPKMSIQNQLIENLSVLDEEIENQHSRVLQQIDYVRGIAETWILQKKSEGNLNYGSIIDIADLIPTKIHEFSDSKEYIDTSCVDFGFISKLGDQITYLKRPSRASMEATIGTVWLGKLAGKQVKCFAVPSSDHRITGHSIISTGFFGLKPKLPEYMYFIYSHLLTEEFTWNHNAFSTGTLMAGLSNSTLKSIPFPMIEDNELEVYCRKIKPLIKQITCDIEASIKLRNLRETISNRHFQTIYGEV